MQTTEDAEETKETLNETIHGDCCYINTCQATQVTGFSRERRFIAAPPTSASSWQQIEHRSGVCQCMPILAIMDLTCRPTFLLIYYVCMPSSNK